MAAAKRADMFTVSYPKPDEKDPKKTWWINVGVAWPQPNGNIKIRLDAVPINFTGELVLFPKQERGDGTQAR